MTKQAVETGPGRLEMLPICSYEECRHPVYGDPVPCDLARRESVFCGFNGKYFKLKEETTVKSTLVQL